MNEGILYSINHAWFYFNVYICNWNDFEFFVFNLYNYFFRNFYVTSKVKKKRKENISHFDNNELNKYTYNI